MSFSWEGNLLMSLSLPKGKVQKCLCDIVYIAFQSTHQYTIPYDIHRPFVMNTQGELKEAMRDFYSGNFGR
jgi:hypothetical protein